jgi:long-chain acyl-CoA synthetase
MTIASTITTTLSRHACETPDRPSAVCDNHAVSWSNLDQAVNPLAGHVAGVVPAGRGAALHLPNGPAPVLLFLAPCRAGREAQILDPSWPAGTARFAIEVLSPGNVVSGDAALAGWTRVLAVVDPHGPLDPVADAIGASPTFVLAAEPHPLALFYVGLMSGSGKAPKGYRRQHQSWIESCRVLDREFDIAANDASGAKWLGRAMPDLRQKFPVWRTLTQAVAARSQRPQHMLNAKSRLALADRYRSLVSGNPRRLSARRNAHESQVGPTCRAPAP